MFIGNTSILKEDWIQSLPTSRMAYPYEFKNRIKYRFWRLYTPYHPFVRDALLSLGIFKHEGRQGFLVGRLAYNESIKSFTDYLVKLGYGNHFVAWKDQGEVVSLRYVIGFEYQYHIRVFADGEVRGHYEYTPECYPIKHLKAIGQEDRRARVRGLG